MDPQARKETAWYPPLGTNLKRKRLGTKTDLVPTQKEYGHGTPSPVAGDGQCFVRRQVACRLEAQETMGRRLHDTQHGCPEDDERPGGTFIGIGVLRHSPRVSSYHYRDVFHCTPEDAPRVPTVLCPTSQPRASVGQARRRGARQGRRLDRVDGVDVTHPFF